MFQRTAGKLTYMAHDWIAVRGVRVHNLKNVTVEIPRNRLTVITGLSGSGKSSLAFDTIYAEGQRRYVESLSAYARQFLGLMEKPDVESIEGLSPAISIEQKSAGHNPRSTVGTVTEIYDYLRVLLARLGTPYCPTCDVPIIAQTADQVVEHIASLEAGTNLLLLAPVQPANGESWTHLLERERASPHTLPELAIDGSDLIAAGFKPGPELGRLLAELLTRVVEDPSKNTREQLLAEAERER